MKYLVTIAILPVLILTSCTIVEVSTARHDNGLHKGWYKNPNNPHNPSHGAASNAHATGHSAPGHTTGKPAGKPGNPNPAGKKR